MEHFTPVSSLIGGLMIGAGAAAMMVLRGRIVGISGMFGVLVRPIKGDTLWRILFLISTVAGAYLAMQLGVKAPAMPAFLGAGSSELIILSGVVVGIGTRIGNGCTSGHGICGIGRLSPRSMVATASFMAAAMVSVFVVHHLILG